MRASLDPARETTPLSQLLTAFASRGFTLQSAPARATLGLAAFAILCGAHGERPLPQDGPRGVLPEGAYTRLVERMQDRADNEFGYGRVVFVDRSASVADERERLSEILLNSVLPAYDGLANGGAAGLLVANDDDGIESVGQSYRLANGVTCLVAGPPADATVEEVAGPDAVDAGVTAVEAFRHAIWREVGHCLLPKDPVAAEAFAGLAGIARGDGGKMVRAMMDRPVDGDGPDARVQSVLRAVAVFGPTQDMSGGGWSGIAARADALASRYPAPTLQAAVSTETRSQPARAASVSPEPVATGAVHPRPVVAEADDDEPEEAPSPGFR